MAQALKAASDTLQLGGLPLAAVREAIAVFEIDPLTNAAKGSNLNLNGYVECDASVMAGDGCFGAIAAASGIQNPCAAATRLALDSAQPLSHGRVRPTMLAGDAARLWALRNGILAAETIGDAMEMHKTRKAQRQHEKYLEIIKEDSASEETREPENKRQKRSNNRESHAARNDQVADDGEDDSFLHDTVGCCVINCTGRVAAGVSSGGIALKTPGRVGEAAVYGAGCWAEEADTASVSVSVTGVGERIMKHLIARECGKGALREAEAGGDVAAACSSILKDTVGKEPAPNDCGVLCCVSSRKNDQVFVQLAAVHCASKSMAVGWLTQDVHGRRDLGTTMLRRNLDGDNSFGDATESPTESMTLGLHWPLKLP